MVFTLTKIAMETVVFFVIYHIVFFQLLRCGLKKLFSSRPWWDYLTTYEGLFTKNTQAEVVYVSLLAGHHFLGGFVMLYAYIYDYPTLYGHAAIWELVDDIHDLMSMIFLLWPFHERDLKLMLLTGSHHLSGIIIIVPVLKTGLYLDRNLHFVGLTLLLAGAVSCFSLTMSRTLDRRIASEAWMYFFGSFVGSTFFLVCRFYVFPRELYLFFVNNNLEGFMKYTFYPSIMLMTLFNILICIDVLAGTQKSLVFVLNNGEEHDFNLSCRCNGCLSRRRLLHDD